MGQRSKHALPQDSQGNRIPTWTPSGGFTAAAATAYTKITIGANTIKLTADDTVTMIDAVVVPYVAGETIGLVDGETYTFGTGQVLGIM